MTDELILQETQAMLDERLKLLDEQMASFAGLSAPARAIEAEAWFRQQITQAIKPMLARVVALEKPPSPVPTAAATKPPKAFIDAIGKFIADELEERDRRIRQLENKIANWKFCGTWSPGQYEPGNHINFDGSTFVCLWATAAKPGTDSSWQLCAKRGKDGRDGRDGRDADNARSPSHR